MKECQVCKKCYTDDVNTCPEEGMPTLHTINGDPVLEGKYHLEKRLGQGGMGVVYKARHAYLKTSHAIKVILPDLVGNDPQLVTRFRQEALAAAAIRHQNVVGVSDYGVAVGTMPFLVMEYVEGESLHDLLAREGKLSPQKALELMSAICAGVGAAHHQGIVHRDLKPLNIMILNEYKDLSSAVKILDFGLAKIKSGELLGSFIQAQTTGLMGSPYYMAPEQWADEEPDASADVYSLGVMLFQMLTGDVPFKGSSIPAIMKKHLSDAPPSFTELGVNVAPQIEAAVRHTLEKNRDNRTPTVEAMVEELRAAVGGTSSSSLMGYVTGASLPVSSLRVLTNPPQSNVYVDSVGVGKSHTDGWLILEGLQSGNHHLRVSHDGFMDWEGNLVCDGTPQQVVAKLQESSGGIPKPMQTVPVVDMSGHNLQTNYAVTQASQGHMQMTANQMSQTGQSSHEGISVESQPIKKKFFSPLVLAIIGIFGLFLLTGIGVGGAYIFGVFPRPTPSVSPTPTESAAASPTQTGSPEEYKTELIAIPGGRFMMGNNEGGDLEKPAHEVEVGSFSMDKTEVTNAEYYEFVKETGYSAPAHWVNNRPLSGTEFMPVVAVSYDDAVAFAKWRSKRNGVDYRLPTEKEWEYAARNGSKNNLYPWGDNWEDGRAVIGKQQDFRVVGSIPTGSNDWGVVDLIGNVWEWTSSNASVYEGSELKLNESGKNANVVRGGGYFSDSTGDKAVKSTTREFLPPNTKKPYLGFRLVRGDN